MFDHQLTIYSVVALALGVSLIAYRNTEYVSWLLVLIVAAWSAQEVDDRVFGHTLNIEMFFVCDVLIVAFIGKYLWDNWKADNLRFQYREIAILGIYFSMWLAYSNLERNPLWWCLYWGNMTQIILAMPWPAFQKIKGSVDHGGIKEAI